MLNSVDARRRWRTFFVPFGALFCLMLSGSVWANGLPEGSPVLISEKDSTRALTAQPTKRGFDMAARVYAPGARTKVTLFVTNLDLLPGEGANAFRADAVDANHRRFPLSIVDFEPTPERPWVYALTVRLHGEIGDVGDVLMRVTWRGMSSNRVRVAVGHEGGGLPDDANALPTPMPEQPLGKQKSTEPESLVGIPFSPDRVRFMEQATFGPTPDLDAKLRRMSYGAWLSEQMEQKYGVDTAGNRIGRFSTFGYPPLMFQVTNPPATCAGTCLRDNYSMYPLQNWFFREALYGEDQQLRRRVSWALSQIWVVSGRDIIQPSRMLPYIELLDKHAFGNYRNLMYDMTLNPAMGQYLDMAISTRTSPNENYAREILQLFSIGVDRLNIDGTPVLDANGTRVPAYDQNMVNNFTKVFTGWANVRLTRQNPADPNSPLVPDYRTPMLVIPTNHDTSSKTLLRGEILPAGQTPEQDLDAAIDNIFNHPNVGPFVSKLLIQQLVTSNPSPAYVERVARVFNGESGRNARGDMKAVIFAIYLDPEARGNIKTDPDYGKLREPVLYVTNVMRALDARGVVRTNPSDGVINSVTLPLDQDVFNPPTVFNYYSMDYTLPNTTLSGPEFGIFSTGTALKRPNFIQQMVGAGTNPTNIPANNAGLGTTFGTSLSVARYQPLAQADPTGALLVDTLNKELMHSSMSPQMRNHILQAVQAVTIADNGLKRTRTAVYLVTTSSQYQVQR